MRDRTIVTLTVLLSQSELVESIAGEVDNECADDPLQHYYFYEVNYGELDFLPKLQELGIAYDSAWESGSNYGPGTSSCRFTPEGEAVLKKLYESDRNPDINSLMLLLDDYQKLKGYIQDHANKRMLLSWNNQEEYGKFYRTKQLISQ